MKTTSRILFVLYLLVFSTSVIALNRNVVFNIIPLGTKGGIVENNLSAFLLAPVGCQEFVLLDAGTIMSGLRKKSTQISFRELKLDFNNETDLAERFFKDNIKGYLISHAHLDHLAGLVIGSPNDKQKTIIGREQTIEAIKEHIFNNKIWPNFANEGSVPTLNKYTYLRLPLEQRIKIPETSLSVEALPLNHGDGYPSTAFLIQAKDHYLLYFGDTGADDIEKSKNLQLIWQKIAPLIRSGHLKAILIECSFPNSKSDHLLFGHLKPKWLLVELSRLAKLVNPDRPSQSLKEVAIVITHIKPGEENGKSTAELIREELEHNHLGLQFIIPQQGKLISV